MDGPGVVVVSAQGDHQGVRGGVCAGDEKGKGQILDDLVAVTGWSRANARRALSTALKRKTPVRKARRKPRPRTYGYDTLTALIRVWRLAGIPSGKYLAATMGLWLPKLEACGELKNVRFSPGVPDQLMAVSGATIADRLPFPLTGLDTDNGGEFINHAIVGWATARDIYFTRARPYKSNDNAHVEQKKWGHRAPARLPLPVRHHPGTAAPERALRPGADPVQHVHRHEEGRRLEGEPERAQDPQLRSAPNPLPAGH